MMLTREDQMKEDDYMFDKEVELCVPGWCLPPPYANDLMLVLKKIEREVGLQNGATALYWHMQPIFHMHYGPKQKPDLSNEFLCAEQDA